MPVSGAETMQPPSLLQSGSKSQTRLQMNWGEPNQQPYLPADPWLSSSSIALSSARTFACCSAVSCPLGSFGDMSPPQPRLRDSMQLITTTRVGANFIMASSSFG
jgi:hypothetical protein